MCFYITASQSFLLPLMSWGAYLTPNLLFLFPGSQCGAHENKAPGNGRIPKWPCYTTHCGLISVPRTLWESYIWLPINREIKNQWSTVFSDFIHIAFCWTIIILLYTLLPRTDNLFLLLWFVFSTTVPCFWFSLSSFHWIFLLQIMCKQQRDFVKL